MVSVTICLYNSSRYIDETLQSVLAQTFQDFELVLVDDGSTDGCADRIERRYRDRRITIVRQRHQGLGVARRVSVAHAKGEYVAFLDHDDLWLPNKLERQVAASVADPAVGLIFSDCSLINAVGQTIGRLSDQYNFGSIDFTGTRGHTELLRRGCFISLSTAFARTAAVKVVGSFNHTYQYVEDYDLWLRLARRYPLKFVAEPLAKWRVHGGQFTYWHPEVALAEQTDLLRPIMRSSSYPRSVRIAIGDNLFGQHRDCCRLLLKQRRFGLAVRTALGVWRYQDRVRDYCRDKLSVTALGRPIERAIDAFLHGKGAIARIVAGILRVRRAPRRLVRILRGSMAAANSAQRARQSPHVAVTPPNHVWIDGSPLGREQTGYFNLVCELIRTLLQRREPTCIVHVVTQRSGRAALLERLGLEISRLRFHPVGWRALHWSDIHRVLFGWSAHVLLALVCTALLTFGTLQTSRIALTAGVVFIVGQLAVLVDEMVAVIIEALGRPPGRWSARLVRFFWKRLAVPRRRSPDSNTVEVLVWRGRFRWRNSHRIAIVQDMTTRIHPELHTEGNIVEFDEFLGYVQRHAHTIATVSEQSRQDIIDRIAVAPDSVSIIPMPVSPVYVRPHFSRGFVAMHGITTPYVLFVGSIEPRKNLRRLVKAFELLKNEEAVRSHVLVLAGPQGWDSGFRRFLVGTDAYPRVRMPGFVPFDHLPSLYHFASAVICPSVYEGFGIPVLEAMCSSAVVLASRISSLPEVLGKEGIQFDPYNTEDIAVALLKALTLSSTEASEYRCRCRSRADALLERWALEPPLPGLRPEWVGELA